MDKENHRSQARACDLFFSINVLLTAPPAGFFWQNF
jgi:hypothetical protein